MAFGLQSLADKVSSPASKLRKAQKLIEQGRRPEAFPLLASAASAGLAEAEFLVARCYLEGAGVPGSAVEGARWLERSANQGYVEAQYLLAALYVHGVAGGTSPVPGGIVAARSDEMPGEADASTDPAARADLSPTRPVASLFAGRSVTATPDFARAAHWARKAAGGGSR